jgi:hypothetical protein
MDALGRFPFPYDTPSHFPLAKGGISSNIEAHSMHFRIPIPRASCCFRRFHDFPYSVYSIFSHVGIQQKHFPALTPYPRYLIALALFVSLFPYQRLLASSLYEYNHWIPCTYQVGFQHMQA